ncbi:MAG: (2Fe-2S)-binding protein [Acidobacteria bacterium]|nr:(2Fe-2S)-binding protein [Acidobacteriota bacterium]
MIRLKINGVSRQFDGEADMPLLWYLRDELQLTGTKYGCGQGLCGACTVHINGEARRSCQTPMQSAAGKEIVTIEGLNPQGQHFVQLAWQEVNVPQCGYCQTGQIMQAAALLRQKAKPTDADIDAAMKGNICRCGTYMRIRAAIKVAAASKKSASNVRAKPAAAKAGFKPAAATKTTGGHNQ